MRNAADRVRDDFAAPGVQSGARVAGGRPDGATTLASVTPLRSSTPEDGIEERGGRPSQRAQATGMEIRIVNVRKEFERFPALHDVSLNIRAGELIALLGPSGSGKTTLLRLIAGLEQTTEGQIFFGDEDASQRSVQDRNVGFVFQHYALFKHLNIAENIGFGLRV